jgi:hypothetical protein
LRNNSWRRSDEDHEARGARFQHQHLIQEGTPEAIRAEVRHLIDTFDRPDGGMCIAAGNGIVSGTPFENIEAFLDECICYGQMHRDQFAH